MEGKRWWWGSCPWWWTYVADACSCQTNQTEGRWSCWSHSGHNLQSPIRPVSTFQVPPPGVSQPSLQYHRLRNNHSKHETIGVFQIQTITEHQPVTQRSHASWDPCIIHHVSSMDHDQVSRSTKQFAAMVSSTKEVKRGWERIVGRGGGIILWGWGPGKFPEDTSAKGLKEWAMENIPFQAEQTSEMQSPHWREIVVCASNCWAEQQNSG